jgi:hypothetical protein
MIHFTETEIEIACKMKKMGLTREPVPGMYFYDPELREQPRTPFQRGVHLVGFADEFLEKFGESDPDNHKLVWLPVWEDGCKWLDERGLPIKHVYYTIKEGVIFYGEKERELLYGEIMRIWEIDCLKKDQEQEEV